MLSIREATENDVALLARVNTLANENRLSAETGWDPAHFAENATESAKEEVAGIVVDSTTYVIAYGGEDVGRLRVIRHPGELHVAGIQILPEHQGKGIGSSVMKTVIEEAAGNDYPLTLEVEKNNLDAKRLYERLGFEMVEDRVDRELMKLRIP